MTSKMLHLFIDGSAKENFIGAGLIIVESHQASPITQSFHMKLNHPATSTIAEFFALRKALEWIQEHQPENDIMIFSDSQDVTSTPTHPMTPPDVLQLLHQLQTSFPHQIHIEQARNQHQPYIDKAHHASRKYRAIMPKGPWSTTRSTIPALGSHAWISIRQQGHLWIASMRNSDLTVTHSDPIEALYETVKLLVQQDNQFLLYFDVNSTQIINHHVRHSPSPQASRLFQCLQKKSIRPILVKV